MISIPQKLQKDIKIFIVTMLNVKIKTFIEKFTELFLCNTIPYKFVTTQLDYNKGMYRIFREFISEIAPIIDNCFENSDYRKNNFYVSNRNVPRYREFCFGSVYYERNYYTDKNKKKGFFFIDELFSFEKYVQYDALLRGLVVNNSVATNANQTCNNSQITSGIIEDSLNNKINRLPRQTIYYWQKKMKIPKINYNEIPVKNRLYIMADEKWIHQQYKKELKEKIKKGLSEYTQDELDEFEKELKKKHYIMAKCFIVFTGIRKKKGRVELIGRHVFVTSSKSPWKDLMEEICKIYDFEKIDTINLLSDAGSWILAGKDELKLYSHNNIIVNTCEFHVKQKINRITIDKELRELLALDVYEYEDKTDFNKFIDLIIEQKPKRKEKIEEYRKYINKHWKSIINMKYSEIKSSMEAHISHYVANHFASRPKGFSINNIEQYLKLETLKNNGFNILDVYLKSVFNKDYTYNEKELDFSMFDKSNSVLPTVCSDFPITLTLKKIAN